MPDTTSLPPQTIDALDAWMTDNCYNSGYAIADRIIHEGYGIDKVDGRFVWYYTERGGKSPIKYFETESEIVAFAFEEIKKDTTANRHCIGFLKDADSIKELLGALNKRKVEYFKDQIPYGGINAPRVRIFVFGCDVKKVLDLQKIYYQPW